ncbi:Peptide synthetase [Pleurostoma richardsiae]|uniref:Brevianamide F synthase n=1 Tax=Pleurostoma richardsiae TaxID=41990 RepID=A0AA38VJS0_9PEZI|nr:Peptide synthetase [Pleurostoma richardsiae]
MQLLRDAQHHLGSLLSSGRATYGNGVEREFDTVAKRAVLPAKSTTSGTEVGSSADIPELALMLAWLLLLNRNSGDGIIQFQWGHQLLGTSETFSPIPGSANTSGAESNNSISELIEVVSGLLRGDAAAKESKLGDFEKVFFCDRGEPVCNGDATSGSRLGQKWSFWLEVCSLDEQLSLQAQWRTTAMTRSQAEDHLEAYVDILAVVLESLSNTEVDILRPLPRELEQIWTWNATVPPKFEQCMHEIIAERAASHSDAPSVSAWDGEFTNAQLDTLSTHLAGHLRSLGVDVGSPVPLCFEKSKWTVVGVLAIMKAGGTFVLMDPSQPPARLATIVSQTGARVLLSSKLQESLAIEIAPSAQVVVVSDSTWSLCDGPPPASLPRVPPDSPMYIIFTSGSTGKPKGVVLSHANYTSGALPRADAVGYREGLRVFEFASYAFDVCIDCILCTLAKGGCVCVPTDEARMNDLSGAIRASGAGMAHMTPSVARVLDPDILPSLEVLGLGGEAISAGDASAWSKKTKIINAYGPSECTVGCTINNTVEKSRGYTNIGKGVGGLTWIVDPNDHDRLVPPGAVGELLVEGPVVGIGYLGEPEKTAEVFIEDPAWLVAGNGTVPGRHGRLYKTGDLVRYDPDGSGAIVFVGRKDQQVKLRGQRVELPEVEHHIRDKIPSSVKMAAEVIKPSGGEPTLVVFLAEPSENVTDATDDSTTTTFSPELSEALASIDARLEKEVPRYMVPSAYIPMRQIPSLVSGKTDRKKLREMGNAMTREQIAKFRIVADKSKPETEAEVALHRVWKKFLGEDLEISLSDSFFALGGDSLKAMKLVAAAREEGLSLTVASVFSYPTLRDMAAMAEKTVQKAQEGVAPFSLLGEGWSAEEARAETARLCDIEKSTIEDVYPCTPLQEALMALSAKIKDAYVAQRVMDLADQETAQRFQAAFEKVAQDCPILRTRIVQVPGHGLVQVVVKESITWRSAGSVQEYLEKDRSEEMDLGKPLVRYGMVTEPDSGKSHFILTIHHSLYDGWSMPLIVDRVNQAYQGSPITRPAEFKDFIHFLTSMDRQACEEYWREQLRGATGRQFPPLPWEGYQSRPDSLLEVYVPLSGRPASNTTVAAVIRGAWALVASNYAASDDMVFGETLTGRNAPVPGVDQIEGPMITTVPVRVRVDRGTRVADYLQAIHDQMVAQIPYEHTGLQHIRRLSEDALQACELRTGLVLHPSAAEEVQEASPDRPADGLVPAGDDEAAQEALKFNTYGLMLVCSLDPKGFLVMASFDSKMVDKQTMERVLDQFSLVTGQLCEGIDRRIGDIDYLTDQDRDEVFKLASQVKPEGDDRLFEGAKTMWIVDPTDPERLLPRGAVGELLIEVADNQSLSALENPKWLLKGSSSVEGREGLLRRTGKLARITPNGHVELVSQTEVTPISSAPAQSQPRPAAISVTTSKQRKLRTLWSRVLRLDEKDIGLSDNFFRLGGDSITAMKLASEARAEGLKLTVAEIFANRSLFEMANVMQALTVSENADLPSVTVKPYQSLDVQDVESFVASSIRPRLADPTWKIQDVLPTRPLQEIAVKGTVDLPRYSMRYELMHFDAPLDADRTRTACQELIAKNEILRTVFVEAEGTYFGVVLDQLTVPFTEYDVEDDVGAFAEAVCKVDVQARVPSGSAFVKWFLIHGREGKTTLIFRLSHAQYDEMCLPLLLRQLSALYTGQTPVPSSVPYSSFVGHVLRDVIPRSIPYWRDLLAGSAPTVLRPDGDVPLTSRRHYATSRAVDIAPRPRDVTVATLPTAAWALCLSRRLGLRDLVFGEVASGRNTELPGCDAVAGPCWQYVPVRARLEAGWTGLDLLRAVQQQHVESSRFEGPALRELVAQGCLPGWPADTDWFDSVVHQDVEHVETLGFGEGEGLRCRTQAVYVHEEPLREWKVQAYHSGESLTMEIVTFESWGQYAEGLLDDLVAALETLVRRPGELI